jgi:alpha-mannosidase
MLDTLLVVRGERERRFRLGIGVDLEHPSLSALELMAPSCAISELASPPSSGSSGWLFHLDARSVVATHWEPLTEDGGVTGVRLRILETEGRAGGVRLDCFRNVAGAHQTDFLGQMLVDLRVEGSLVLVDVTAYEYLQIDVHWREN